MSQITWGLSQRNKRTTDTTSQKSKQQKQLNT